MKTKYEVAEEQPVFEEEIHGATAPSYQNEQEEMEKLSKSTTSSSMESVEDDKE